MCVVRGGYVAVRKVSFDAGGAGERSTDGVQHGGRAGPDGGGGLLFDDLRAVAPGLGLPLGQGQPGGLRGHLLRVTGGEAL